MRTYVVDTNVAIVANGGSDANADYTCQQECIERLTFLIENGIVAIDDYGLILSEYAKNLSWSGGPGVGDFFFKFIFNHQYGAKKVRRVMITIADDHRKGYDELPNNTFDPSDRKFLAVAVVADAVVLNATDSDWSEHASLVDELGVQVEQLCPQHAER